MAISLRLNLQKRTKLCMIVRPLNHTGVLKRTKILILVKSIHVKDVAKHPEEFTVESVYVRLYLWAAFSHRGARKKATTRSA